MRFPDARSVWLSSPADAALPPSRLGASAAAKAPARLAEARAIRERRRSASLAESRVGSCASVGGKGPRYTQLDTAITQHQGHRGSDRFVFGFVSILCGERSPLRRSRSD